MTSILNASINKKLTKRIRILNKFSNCISRIFLFRREKIGKTKIAWLHHNSIRLRALSITLYCGCDVMDAIDSNASSDFSCGAPRMKGTKNKTKIATHNKVSRIRYHMSTITHTYACMWLHTANQKQNFQINHAETTTIKSNLSLFIAITYLGTSTYHTFPFLCASVPQWQLHCIQLCAKCKFFSFFISSTFENTFLCWFYGSQPHSPTNFISLDTFAQLRRYFFPFYLNSSIWLVSFSVSPTGIVKSSIVTKLCHRMNECNHRWHMEELEDVHCRLVLCSCCIIDAIWIWFSRFHPIRLQNMNSIQRTQLSHHITLYRCRYINSRK